MTEYLWIVIYDYVVCILIWFIHVLLHEWFRIFYVYFTKYALCMFLNYVCFTHFGLFDVAKGGDKNGYFK